VLEGRSRREQCGLRRQRLLRIALTPAHAGRSPGNSFMYRQTHAEVGRLGQNGSNWPKKAWKP